MRHLRVHNRELDDLMGVRGGQLHKPTMPTDTGLRKERDGCGGFSQSLHMTGMPGFASRSASVGGLHPSLALCRGCIH